MNPSSVVATKTLPFKRKPVAALIVQKPKEPVGNVACINKSDYLTDKHEQQARSYGRAWKNHENGIVKPEWVNGFLATRAASYYVPGSLAEKIPSTLEQKLSGFFNADLSAVRIHRDQAAHRISQQEQARAFAAGAHVYFAEQEYVPGSEASEDLLVHELTHVLQQTGRASTGNRMRVTDIGSDGEIQRTERFTDFIHPYQTHAISAPEGTSEHRTQQSDFDSIKSVINTIIGPGPVNYIDEAQGQTAAALELQAAVIIGDYDDYDPRAKSLLFDVMKLWNLYEAAAHLIDQDEAIQTRRHPDEDFIQFIYDSSNYGPEAVKRLLERGDNEYDRVWPYNLTTELWNSLRSIQGRPNPTTRSYPSNNIEVWRAYRDADQDLVDNELHFLARDQMFRADQLRLTVWLGALQAFEALEEDDSARQSPAQAIYFLSNQIAEALNSRATDEDVVLRRARRAMRGIARGARTFWRDAIQLGRDVEQDSSDRFRAIARRQDAPDSDLMGAYPSDPVLRELLGTIIQYVGIVFYGNPEPAEADSIVLTGTAAYREDTNEFAEALLPFTDLINQRVDSLFVFERRNQDDTANLVQWLVWAQQWAKGLENKLRSIRQSSGSFTDLRSRILNHRLDLALRLNAFAMVTDNRFVLDTITAVLRAEDTNRSYLILNGSWQQTSNDLDEMDDDFHPNRRIGGWGMTIHQLTLFYHLLYQSDLTTRLRRSFEVAPDSAADEDAHRAFLDESVQALNSVFDPQRCDSLFPMKFVNALGMIIYYPEDTLTIHQMLLQGQIAHAEFTQFLTCFPEGSETDYLAPAERSNSFYIWVLPPMDLLIRRIMRVPVLRDMVPIAGSPPADWFDRLTAHLLELDDDEISALTPLITSEYDKQWRQANAWRRRVSTERVRSRLITAAENRGDIRHYSDTSGAIDELRDFLNTVRPTEDRRTHAAMMVLDLADELRSALIDDPSWFEEMIGVGQRIDRRYQVITRFDSVITRALEFLDEPDALNRMNLVVALSAQQEILSDSEKGPIRQARVQSLMSSRQTLTTIKETLDAAILEIQLEGTGFEARASEGLSSMHFGTPLALNSEMFYEGKIYVVTRIHTDFDYFPAYGADADVTHDSILRRPGEGTDNAISRTRSTPLITYTVDGRERTITSHSRHDSRLDELTSVVANTSFVNSLNSLADMIESGTELTMDLIELIPGFGQAFMLARMTAEIARFAITEWPRISEAISNPTQMFNDVAELFDTQLAPEPFLDWLIFEAGTFNLPTSLSGSSEDTGHSSRRRNRRLDRLIHSLKTLGEKIFFALQLLQRNMRGGFVGAQARLIEYRMVMRLFEIMPGLVLTAADMDEMVEELGDSADANLIRISHLLTFITSEDGFERKLDEVVSHLLEGLNSLELPDNIAPTDALVDILLGFVLDKFGRKGKLLNDVITTLGVRQQVSMQINELLVVGSDIDVNLHWRTHFREPLRARLADLQNFILNGESNNGLNSLIRSTIGARYEIELPAPTIGERSGDTVETQPYRRSGMNENAEFFVNKAEAGQPLPNQRRKDLEREFGHNLEHVRLHRGDAANQLTENSWAHALTSGSHIFLAEDLNLGTEQGSHILRHEIAHVLQQTGDRVLSEKHENRPVWGSIGKGVQHDHDREEAAERMANLARRGSGLVDIEGRGGSGLYPDSRTFVLKILSNLSDGQLSDQVLEDMEDRIPRLSAEERSSFREATEAAKLLWRNVISRVRTGTTGVTIDNPFRAERTNIAAAINTLYTNVTRNEINVLRALVFRSVRQRSSGMFAFKPKKFMRQLKTYIYAKTGIVMNYDVSRRGRLTGVYITYIHLGNTPTRSQLWTKVKTITQSSAHSVTRPNWPRIANYIRSTQHQTRHVWDTSHFMLHSSFVDEVNKHFRQVAEDDVALGTWQQYTTPALSSGEDSVGLRVGTHGQLTANSNPTAPPGQTRRGSLIHDAAKVGRQSHHVPQYLLVEYFRDAASTNHSVGTNRLPGFVYSGAKANSFNDGSGHSIDLQRLDPGGARNRGLNIPAVSLAAVTHQQGQLHVNQVSGWSEELEQGDRDSLTQSLWLDFYFYQQLKNELRSEDGFNSVSGKENIINQVKGLAESVSKPAIYRSMQSSYSVMYRHMKAMLSQALERHEPVYYRDIALSRPNETMRNGELRSSYTPSNQGLSGVVSAVENLNSSIMSDWGA